MQGIKIIGMMSGTSLDGVDLALCQYSKPNEKWTYKLLLAKTYPYPNRILQILEQLTNPSITYLQYYHKQIEYSDFIVQMVREFTKGMESQYQYLSIHGHTVYHNPANLIAVQCGNIHYIAAGIQKHVIGNFRQMDVYKGGEGAPLAPYGEQLFESIGDVFLNLGGIANIGFRGVGTDINFCNLFFNYFANIISGQPYDKDGQNGQKGKYNSTIEQYFISKCKFKFGHSLSREQFQAFIQGIPLLYDHLDIVATFYRFLAKEVVDKCIQIKNQRPDYHNKQFRVVCSGGGTYNQFLIRSINHYIKQCHQNITVVIPSKQIIEFKQAILFGLLGAKYLMDEQNCQNGIGGCLAKYTQIYKQNL